MEVHFSYVCGNCNTLQVVDYYYYIATEILVQRMLMFVSRCRYGLLSCTATANHRRRVLLLAIWGHVAAF